MPTPTTVASFNGFGDVGAFHGPYQYGTSLFLVLVDKTNHEIQVVKSTDYGATWSECDSAASSKPAIYYAVAGYQSLSVFRRGNVLWITFLYPSGTSAQLRSMRHQTFDLATSTWGSLDLELSATNTAVVTAPGSGMGPQFYTVRRKDDDSIGVTDYAYGHYTYFDDVYSNEDYLQANEYDSSLFLHWTGGSGYGSPSDDKDYYPGPWIIAPESIETGTPNDPRIWGFFVVNKTGDYTEWNQVTVREHGNHYSGGAGTWTEGSTPPTANYNLSNSGGIIAPCMIGQGIYYTQSSVNKLAVPFIKASGRLWIALAPAGDPDSSGIDEWGDPYHPDDFPAWTMIDCGVDVGLDDDGKAGFMVAVFYNDCLYIFYRSRNLDGTFNVSYVKFCSGGTTPSSKFDAVSNLIGLAGVSGAVFTGGSGDVIGLSINNGSTHEFVTFDGSSASPQTVTAQGVASGAHVGIPEAEGTTTTQYITY